MDSVDRRLLTALRANARVTFAELARALQMSAPAVHDRVVRLEQQGVIRGYRVDVDQEALGRLIPALVDVHLTAGADYDDVAKALAGVSEIEDCWLVAGDESFVVSVRVETLRDLEGVTSRLRAVEGVDSIRTRVVLSEKWRNRYPDRALE